MSGNAAIGSGIGLTDPSLAFGLTGLSDYSTEMPFLDLMKDSRPFVGSTSTTYAAMSYQTLQADGYLDANGYPTKIPLGVTNVGTIWDWSGGVNDANAVASRAGVYVLNYSGEGTIQVGGSDLQVLSSKPGQIIFDNLNGGTMWLDITSTDPNNTGNYIHDISVVNEKYEGLYQAGEIFNPNWLSVINDARELRFMGWMDTNTNTTASDWEHRPQVGNATYMGEGVPVEVMVQLANQTGTDPWFNMPIGATANYIQQFATYVRDHLDPGLVAHVEYGNEAWNGSLPTFDYVNQQSFAQWGEYAPFDYYAMEVTKMGEVWDRVFGSQTSSRVDIVMATQTANSWISREELTAPIWQAHDPTGYVAPSTVVGSLAVTTYFGYSTVADPTLRADLLNEIATHSEADATAWLATKLMDPNYVGSIPQVEALWGAQKAVAERYGVKLVAYEGGQHVQQSFAIPGLTSSDLATLTSFLSGFVRSQAMADLYSHLWADWAQISNGPFMQFTDVSAPTDNGSWGMLAALGDTNPRAAVLLAQNDQNSAWFGTGGGAQYQQGVITLAADNNGDLLTGTTKDDYLVGGSGNDVIIPGTGHDGINGGGGIDTVVLSGNPNDYALTHDGNGYLLTGPSTSDYIINVEQFQFDHGVKLSLDNLLKMTSANGWYIAQPGVATLTAMQGTHFDAAAVGVTQLSIQGNPANGMIVDAIGSNGTLGHNLGLSSGDVAPSYFIAERSAGTDFLGTQVAALFPSLQHTAMSGTSASPLTTALEVGSAVTNVQAIIGTPGNDVFHGSSAVDIFYGGAGNDYINGGGGADRLYGGAGNDVLVGNGGGDELTGGAGNDRFYITGGAGGDKIMDFTHGDVLDLRALHLPAGEAIASLATTDNSGDLQIIHDHTTITLVGLHESDLGWMSILM